MLSSRRILLIEPPFYRLFHKHYSLDKYPLSLAYLAEAIRRHTDWEVMVYNADFTPRSIPMRVSYLSGQGFEDYVKNLKSPVGGVWGETEATIRRYRPSVVGITCKTQNLEAATLVARIAKQVDPHMFVIVGGPHPSMMGAETARRPEFDICVRGEGDETIVELLEKIGDREQWKGIRGILYRDDGRVVTTADREPIRDLDSLCYPQEHAEAVLKDYKKYPRRAFRYIFAIRGCPYRCWFCGSRNVWGGRVRRRSAQHVAQEMRMLKNKGIDNIHFDDDTFGVSRRYIVDLCESIRQYAPGTRWSCETSVRLLDDGVLGTMKESGCVAIELGVESGNNEILHKIRKEITIEQAIEACDRIKKAGLSLSVFFMAGFPWDTEATLYDSLEAIKRIAADTTIFSIFMPYPGTEAYEFCKTKGLIPDDFDYFAYNHQSPRNCFCLDVDRAWFRSIVSEFERVVDDLNAESRRRYIRGKCRQLSIREIGAKAREYGLVGSLKRVWRFGRAR